LEQAIQATICALDGCTLEPLTPGDFVPFGQSRALLAHMIFCYARQIYGSAEVAKLARHDEDFAVPGGEEFPDARTICRFRSENRVVIHHCLQAALRFLAEQKISLGVLTRVNDAQLAEEASRRIIMATFVDSLQLDEAPLTDPLADISYLFANGHPPVH
jgi:hypothetical protein